MTLSDETFDDMVLKGDGPAVVIFWKPYCMACKGLLGALAMVARQLTTTRFFMMNGHKNPRTRERFSVEAYPALLVFKDGAVVDRKYGMSTVAELVHWIRGA